VTAAHVLGLSTRHVRRLLDKIRTTGAASIRHKAIGRPSNNRIGSGVRDYVLTLVRDRYLDFGPTLAVEKLVEDHGVTVSRETLRKWMSGAGIWLSRRQDQLPVPQVKTNSEKGGYKPTGRKPGRRTDFISDPAVSAKRQAAFSRRDAAE
jgi:hypothetical protein